MRKNLFRFDSFCYGSINFFFFLVHGALTMSTEKRLAKYLENGSRNDISSISNWADSIRGIVEGKKVTKRERGNSICAFEEE